MTDAAETKCAACDDRGWNLRDCRIEPCDCGTYDPPKWARRGDTPCLVPHHKDPNRPRRAHVGYMCRGHFARFEQMLAELPALHDDLGLMLATSEKPGEQGRSKHGQVSGEVKLNQKVVDAREELHAEAVRMTREVAEARGLSLPSVDTIPALAVWLTSQAEWMAAQLDADDTYRYLADLRSKCVSLAFPTGRRRIKVGPCGDGDCPGELVTVISRTADLLPDRLWCDECGREIMPGQWRQLRARLTGQAADVVLTVPQAADAYAVPYRTLARWVADGRLVNVADGYPAQVRASEVEEIMAVMGASLPASPPDVWHSPSRNVVNCA